MCDAMEKLIAEREQDIIKKLVESNVVTVEQISDVLQIPIEEIELSEKTNMLDKK